LLDQEKERKNIVIMYVRPLSDNKFFVLAYLFLFLESAEQYLISRSSSLATFLLKTMITFPQKY